MPFPTLVPHVNGEPCEFLLGTNPIYNNVGQVHLWLNAIEAADIDAGAVQLEHVVRPRFVGGVFIGQRRMISPIAYGLQETSADGMSAALWATRSQRLSFDPSKFGNGEVWRTPIGATFTVPGQADMPGTQGTVSPTMRIDLSCEMFIRSPDLDPVYPDGNPSGAVARVRGGNLRIYVVDREANVENALEETSNYLYPLVKAATASVYQDQAYFQWQSPPAADVIPSTGTLIAGRTYDVFLGYARFSESVSIAQIDIARVVGKIDITW
jgi:hypothetical protein